MKKTLIVLLVFVAAGCTAYVKKAPSYYYAKSLYDESMELFERGRLEEAYKKADEILTMQDKTNPYFGKVYYLKARIYVEMARMMRNPVKFDLILGRFRDRNNQALFNNLLMRAVYNINSVVMLYPKDELAPKAFLLLARIYDKDNLEQFAEAITLYNTIIMKYPDSEERIIAEERIRALKMVYEDYMGTPHGGIN